MSLKRRIKRLEKAAGKGNKEVVFYDLVVTGASKDNGPIYHYEKVIGDKRVKLTIEEYEKDAKQEMEKGNTVILDGIVGLDELSTRELKLLARQ